MFDKMKQLMEMKKQADRIKRELDETHIDSQEVNGIKIVVSGSQDFQSIEIDENLIKDQAKANLESDLVRSVNAAIKQSQKLAADKMKEALPGFPGM